MQSNLSTDKLLVMSLPGSIFFEEQMLTTLFLQLQLLIQICFFFLGFYT